MKFVDRIDEAARLKDALAREKSSLVVMYGRRRLCKSTLIKRVLSENYRCAVSVGSGNDGAGFGHANGSSYPADAELVIGYPEVLSFTIIRVLS